MSLAFANVAEAKRQACGVWEVSVVFDVDDTLRRIVCLDTKSYRRQQQYQLSKEHDTRADNLEED